MCASIFILGCLVIALLLPGGDGGADYDVDVSVSINGEAQ